VNRLGLSASLLRCLASTNVIESPQSGVRLRTRRICRGRDGGMALRWTATAFLETEKHFRRTMGCRDLWMLEAALAENQVIGKEKVA
jgi:putative transposase